MDQLLGGISTFIKCMGCRAGRQKLRNLITFEVLLLDFCVDQLQLHLYNSLLTV